MSKPKIQVKADLSVIKSQLRKNEKFTQGICLHTVYQTAKGNDVKELQELYSSSHKSICNWIHRYNRESIDGLKDRTRSSRKPLLDASYKTELEKIICQTPQEYSYDTATRTGASVIDFVEKRYGVKYKKLRFIPFHAH